MNCLDEATVVSNLQIISADVARAVELWLAHEPKALPTAEEHRQRPILRCFWTHKWEYAIHKKEKRE